MTIELISLISRNLMLSDQVAAQLSANGLRLHSQFLTAERFASASREGILECGIVLLLDSGQDDVEPGDVAKLRRAARRSHLVVMASHFNVGRLNTAQEAGADSYLITDFTHRAIDAALKLIAGREPAFETLFDATLPASASAPVDSVDPGMACLSERETNVLKCLSSGKSNKLIARELDLSEATVKVHVKAILRKTGTANRTQAAAWALRHAIAS